MSITNSSTNLLIPSRLSKHLYNPSSSKNIAILKELFKMILSIKTSSILLLI